MRKLFSLFAALTLCVGLWATAPANVESVDLGLPSGLKWATFNVGATAPEGYGDYFAWGETSPKTTYAWSTYFDTKDGGSTFIKYNNNGGKTVLDLADDAAHVNWGSDWRMPTKAELDELINNCTWTWTADYNGTGIKGYIVTSKAEGNTNSIFLPAAGNHQTSSVSGDGSYGYYLSSSLYEETSSLAYYLYLRSSSVNLAQAINRRNGQSVRPVTTQSIVPGPKVSDQFEDTTSSLKFEVTAVGDTNTVKVIANSYTGTAYEIPATVSYNDVTFAVTEIGEKAFQNCSALQSVTIPASVTTIGKQAFGNCSALTSVTFLGNACQEGIAANAFVIIGNTTPVLLTLPDNWGDNRPVNNHTIWCGRRFEYEVPVLGDEFEDATSGLKFEITAIGETNTVKVISNAYTGTSYTVPATVKHKEVDFAVTEIEAGAFSGRRSLQSVTIPASVTTIGKQAFGNCSALTSVTFLGNACQESIGSNAFAYVGTPDPALLTLPANWTGSKPVDNQTKWYGGYFNYTAPAPKVGDKFVDATSGLWFEATAVGEANTVKVIRDNYSGTSYTVPDTVKYLDVDFAVTEIEEYAFATCSSLESVTIPASVATIGKDAFYDCSSLQSVTLSEGLLTIGEYAFKGCSALQTITIPAGVTTIGESAFEGCSSLESVTIPAGVTTIGEFAFAECAGLTSVTFLGNACQDAIGYLAFDEVGKDAPVLLTLHGTWAKENLPDDLGNWYGGKFELSSDPTALPTLPYEGKVGKGSSKFLRNGQLIIRKGGKTYNAVGF